MLRYSLIPCIAVLTVLLFVSCTSRPDYNEENRVSVEKYFEREEEKVKPTRWIKKDSIYEDYVGTKLDMRDNRDISASYEAQEGSHHTPFVTRFDPYTKVNVGPGHVPGKTKWCSICKAEVSINEQEPHRHYKDKDGKDRNTEYSYLEDREVGWNYIFRKTEFKLSAGREVDPEMYVPDVTRWDPVYKKEVGPNHDPDMTRFCPTCEADVAEFSHKKDGALHYGHACDITVYSSVWMIDMFRKGLNMYEKLPSSRIDYEDLDKDYAPDTSPRISQREPTEEEWGARPENTMPGVRWVENRMIKLDRDDIETYKRLRKHYKETQGMDLWWWEKPKYERLTFDLAERKVLDVGKEARSHVEKSKEVKEEKGK